MTHPDHSQSADLRRYIQEQVTEDARKRVEQTDYDAQIRLGNLYIEFGQGCYSAVKKRAEFDTGHVFYDSAWLFCPIDEKCSPDMSSMASGNPFAELAWNPYTSACIFDCLIIFMSSWFEETQADLWISC